MTIVRRDQEAWTVVHLHAIMTLTASTKNATMEIITVAWIPTAVIGQNVTMSHNVHLARETVMMIQIVKGHLCVALTIVSMAHLFWIVVKTVKTRYTKVNSLQQYH